MGKEYARAFQEEIEGIRRAFGSKIRSSRDGVEKVLEQEVCVVNWVKLKRI